MFQPKHALLCLTSLVVQRRIELAYVQIPKGLKTDIDPPLDNLIDSYSFL